MTGKTLVQITGAKIVERNGQRIVHVDPRFSLWARRRQNQTALRRALRRPDNDIDLREGVDAALLQALGFSLDDSIGGFVFPAGDEAGEQVLLGINAPPAVLAPHPLTPQVVMIEAERVRPGQFRWSEPAGARVVVVHRGRRLT